MVKALGRELLKLIVTLFATSVLIAGIVYYSPGGRRSAKDLIAQANFDAKSTSVEDADVGFVTIYRMWLSHALVGDLGKDASGHAQVADQILERLPTTALLICTAILFSLLWGQLSTRLYDAAGKSAKKSLAAVPALFICFLPAYVVAKWSHISGWRDEGLSGALITMFAGALLSIFDGYFLEVFMHSRAQTEKLRAEEYYTMALLKGADVKKHTKNDRIIHSSHLIFMRVAALISGSVVLEVALGKRGIGDLLLSAYQERDIGLMLGTVSMLAAVVVILTTAHNITALSLDPRLRGGKK